MISRVQGGYKITNFVYSDYFDVNQTTQLVSDISEYTIVEKDSSIKMKKGFNMCRYVNLNGRQEINKLYCYQEIYNYEENIILRHDKEIVTISGESSNIISNCYDLLQRINSVEEMINNVHFKFTGDDRWYIVFYNMLVKLSDEPLDLLKIIQVKSARKV